MQNEITTQNQYELSLDSLGQRVAKRESEIDELRGKTAEAALRTIQRVVEQGKDLLQAKERMGHGALLDWLNKFFPKSIRTAQRYMAVAIKCDTVSYLDDAAFQLEMFKAAQLIPETEKGEANPKGLSLPPIINHLNFVAEWFVKESVNISTWDENRRAELRVRLKPVVELYQTL